MQEQIRITEETAAAIVQEALPPDAPAQEELNLYPFDAETLEIRINLFPEAVEPVWATHFLRKPSFDEEDSRERASPFITEDAGKVEGHAAQTFELENAAANAALYDKIIKSVQGGYVLSGRESSDEPIPVDAELKKLIPVRHKSTAISGLYRSSFESEMDATPTAFILGASREWVIQQEIGGGRRADGTVKPPDFVIRHTMTEPTEEQHRKFRRQAVSAKQVVLRGGVVREERRANLRVIADMYDALVQRVEGAMVGGEAVNASDRQHLRAISAVFKNGVVTRLFQSLEADLGN